MAMPDKATAQERDKQRRAMELRLEGWPYDDIARELGYADHSGAFRAVQAGFKRVESPLVDELRKAEDMRLEALFRKHWPDARDGDQKAAELVLKIHDRRVKLHGLAMPERMVIAQLPQVDKDQTALDIYADMQAIGYAPPRLPIEEDDPGEPWSNL